MLSFWERESFIKHDYAVIGSGIVGLSTAIAIKENSPGASVIVLEKGILPTGASTKNAGFACFGSLTELLNDIKELGEENALHLVNERNEGLRALRKRLGDKTIGYEPYGGYELINKEDIHYLDKINYVNNWLTPLFDQKVFSEKRSMIGTFGFSKKHTPSVIFNQYEGQLHTGKMIQSLLTQARRLNIQVFTGAEVEQFEDHGNDVSITVKNIDGLDSIVYNARKVAICTNAFTKSLIPEISLNPGRGVVLVTKPIKNLKFKGCFHIDQGYYYFRDINSRILFGGGRNLFFEEETTTDFEINKKIIADLHDKLDRIIIPGTTYEVEQTWAGIMGFGNSKSPIIQSHTKNIFLGVRLGGMGVAIGSRVGEKLAQMVL